MKFVLAAITAAMLAIGSIPASAQTPPLDPENTLYLDLFCGRVSIQLRPDLAPLHVERIKTLTRQGFYNGIVFHRVISGFMAQTGDPTGTGRGGSPLPNLPAEFTPTPFERGTVGMARAQSPNSANSQFFIMFADGSFLNNNYTVWGQVVEGMECVDQIARGEPPASPDRIIAAQIAADIPAGTPAPTPTPR
jgi:cyclophilin family peptidyl-prolyl cis-trans isomerase